MKKILINATNLNEGGGVQVATSFLKDLTSLEHLKDIEWSVYVSPAVQRNLNEIFFDKKFFIEYQIVEPKEISFLNSYKLNQYDVVFTVFGPMFLPLYRGRHISGFAQPWVIYPVEDVLKKFSFIKQLFFKFKYSLISFVFRHADILVVESSHIKNLLIKKGFTNQIAVVENAVSSVFFNEEEWKEINTDVFDSNKINIGVLSGSYPHKNLDFVVKLAWKLENTYPNTFNFIFTIRPDKFKMLTHGIQISSLRNLGLIQITQCPDFYRQIDAMILPSLLECFSITPYEAMLMKRVIFLSDREFFKESCDSHAFYFDPLSIDQAEKVLSDWFFDTCQSKRVSHINAAHEFVINKSWSVTKANSYMNLLLESL